MTGLLSADFARGKRILQNQLGVDQAFRIARLCAVREERMRVRVQLEQRGAVEEESGIGGKMVRTARRTASKSNEQRTGRNGTRSARAGELVEGEGIQVKEMLGCQVTENALSGAAGSCQQLLEQTNGASASEGLEANSNGFSQAIAWGAEPEWQDESSEEASETAAGSREPEGCLED